MNLLDLIDWYRSILAVYFPRIAQWRVEHDVYWLPVSGGLGLCATSNGAVVQVELCRGLSGETVATIEHPLDKPVHAETAAQWIGQCATLVLEEAAQILEAAGSFMPVSMTMDRGKTWVDEVRRAPETDKTSWEVEQNSKFYSTVVDLLMDTRCFLVGSVVVVLFKNHNDAINIATHLIIGNQKRENPVVNPVYFVGDQDAPRVVQSMRRSGLSQGAIDNLKIVGSGSPDQLPVWASDHQFVLVHTRDRVGTYLFEVHLRDLLGDSNDDKIPLYHVMLAETGSDIAESIGEITKIDTGQMVSSIYLAENSHHLKMVWVDNRLDASRRPPREHIYLPPFAA